VIPIKERGSKKDGTGDWRKKRSGDAFFFVFPLERNFTTGEQLLAFSFQLSALSSQLSVFCLSIEGIGLCPDGRYHETGKN